MIALDDIEIKIKKYDTNKNTVILNLLIYEQLELRGFTVRFAETKYSKGSAVWIVTPPSVRGRNKTWFHIVRVKDSELWKQLEKEIIAKVREYTSI